ncbi:hypothetical protein AALO_G00147110 [Alosa alosa]|uniref:Uncharacterized protein n=1 Tax=Alosa alosa TaxID=278164 RepID=A0AAV6GE08_9TELE|nr:hypothetical protein AALO_G00147110 [Alosa alosa]
MSNKETTVQTSDGLLKYNVASSFSTGKDLHGLENTEPIVFFVSVSEIPPLEQLSGASRRHSDRILIKSPHLREALKRYGEGLTGQDEWAQLLVVAEKEAPFILPLLRNMAEEGHIIKPDEPYRALFKELAKATPACALCHLGPEMDSIIKCLMTSWLGPPLKASAGRGVEGGKGSIPASG